MCADPDPVTGRMESAMAVELNPWVEYEFRVVASNAIGTGDPSAPSRVVRTKEAGKVSKQCSEGTASRTNIAPNRSEKSYLIFQFYRSQTA